MALGTSAAAIKRQGLGKATLVYPCTGSHYGDMSGKSCASFKDVSQKLTMCKEVCKNMCYGIVHPRLLPLDKDQS